LRIQSPLFGCKDTLAKLPAFGHLVPGERVRAGLNQVKIIQCLRKPGKPLAQLGCILAVFLAVRLVGAQQRL
jgi:hypothetical protein